MRAIARSVRKKAITKYVEVYATAAILIINARLNIKKKSRILWNK
jgi:hypothetical protein